MKYRLADPVIDEIQLEGVREVLLSKQLVHGQYCNQFESDLADYLGVDNSQVAVTSSCTASLHLALLALGIGPGDVVIVPNFTFPATVNVVEVVGATPLFVDVNENHYVATPEGIQEAYESYPNKSKIKAIIIVHEFGATADMTVIGAFAKEKGLWVIEDAACAFGSSIEGKKVGLLSDIGCYSFHPRKALTTGEGGAVVANDSGIIERCKVLRNHGMQAVDGKIDFVMPGLNYRMTNFQAVLGIEQLKHFDDWVEIRKSLQVRYREKITSQKVIHPEDQQGHTWQSYMIALDASIHRDELILALRQEGVETNYGAYAVLSTQYYKERYGSAYTGKMRVSEHLYKHGLCLPLHQKMTLEDVDVIAEILNTYL